LKEYLIGTGGWAYFQVPGLHPLIAYSRAFNFVEVNSTFYQLPSTKEVENWRKLVPSDFQFSVRAHRSITHDNKLQPKTETFKALEKTKEICRALKANIMHLQTPPSLKLDSASASNLDNLLTSADLGKIRIALEVRNARSSELAPELVGVMQDHGIIHCVDLLRGQKPAYPSDTLYTRLFGKGSHNTYQPTDEELAEVDHEASSGSFEKVAMSFHFVRMYKDAARMKIYKQTGKFPTITKSVGLYSLDEILVEDAHFPMTKQELIYSQGWKLFDMTKDRKMHASDLLTKLPERTYNNINEVIEGLRPTVR
jgi:uncharacterized protein YecE (DUF72 family)